MTHSRTTLRRVLRRWLFTLGGLAVLLTLVGTVSLLQQGIARLTGNLLLSLALWVALIALLQGWLLVSPCGERLGDWLAHRLAPDDPQWHTRRPTAPEPVAGRPAAAGGDKEAR